MTITVLAKDQLKTLSVEPNMSVLDALRTEAEISAPCGGQGTCGKCRIWLVDSEGEASALACRTKVRDGMTLRLPDAQPPVVEMSASNEAAVCPPDPGQCGCGIACDIGTTTVVCRLVDLSDGRILATMGEGNVQRAYGGDVISRIKAAMEGFLPALTDAMIGQLSRMIRELCGAAGLELSQVHRMSVAANTTMCHLLTGLPPDSLGLAPFTPLSRFGTEYSAEALGLPFSGDVYIAPAISGYVGGDITADLLATALDRADSPVLLIDVGTNGEMALGFGDRFLCCSTAAGPAFEGAQIRCGMTASPGAISAVELVRGKLSCKVIGDTEAVGLCGSGLIDAAAVMLQLGAMDETGRLLDPEEVPPDAAPYLFLLDDELAFYLTNTVCVTQSDIRKLQLGKGAIAAGVQVLMDTCGITCDKIGALLLSGGFGSYIRPESAARIGLIPEELLPVTRAVGNTALQGAQAALVSSEARARLDRLQAGMEYLELSGLPAFSDAYMEAMMFPEED